MLPIRVRTIFSLSMLVALGAAGCSPQDFEEVAGSVGDVTSPPAGVAIPFEEVSDDVGARAGSETRILIRTQQGYQALFGHAAPAGVDFARQWMIFYAAGTRPTGGYDANLSSLTRVGDKLVAVTELVSPGAGCAVTDALTSPSVLVKFAAQTGAAISFLKKNSTHDCEPTNPCAAVLCPVGTRCTEEDVICVTAPCPKRGSCLPDPTVTRCGGIAGIPCPTGQTCVDDPSDGCDPGNGGADCGGICIGDPNVVHCGGFGGIRCPGVGTCVDDPNDSCDPQNGDVDCGGVCRCAPVPCPSNAKFDSSPAVCACVAPPPPPKVFCGGIAGLRCPGGGRCVDDPSDSCDPNQGDADCGGMCQCIQTVACVRGAVFDSSPKVCACVKQICGPVCEIFCQYGNVLDANGCPTCSCNPAPTP